MKLDNNPDITEIEYLNKAGQIIKQRINELLLPKGLRQNEYASWPFKLAKLLTVITSPGHYVSTREETRTKTREESQKPRSKELVSNPPRVSKKQR